MSPVIVVKKLKLKFVLSFLFVILILGLIPWTKEIRFANGGEVRITTASFCRSLFPEANSTIFYQPKLGHGGKIVLWADLFDGPIILIPASETNVVFCLYDYDVHIVLFKIDTSKEFKQLSPASSINSILFSSTWEISYGTSADWQEVLCYLRQVPPNVFKRQSVNVGTFPHDTSQSILARVAAHGIDVPPK